MYYSTGGADEDEEEEPEDVAVDPAAGRDGRKWKAALDAWKAASEKAISKRAIADVGLNHILNHRIGSSTEAGTLGILSVPNMCTVRLQPHENIRK